MSESKPLEWSFSRAQTFKECKRQYYYAYYLARNGWQPESTPESRDAYRLKSMTSLPLLAGSLVHDRISEVINAFRKRGVEMTLEQSLEVVEKRWQRALKQSGELYTPERDAGWMRLIEDHRSDPNAGERKLAKWKHITNCLTSFHESEFWATLRDLSPKQWLVVDDNNDAQFQAFSVNDMPVIAKLDIGWVVEQADDYHCHIWDFKTGLDRPSDKSQVAVYIHYANARWQIPIDRITAHLLYLEPEPCEVTHQFTTEELANTATKMRDSFDSMCSLVDDPISNQALDIEYFPVATTSRPCTMCNFIDICHDRPGYLAYSGPIDI